MLTEFFRKDMLRPLANGKSAILEQLTVEEILTVGNGNGVNGHPAGLQSGAADDNPLRWLPCGRVFEAERGDVIYGPDAPTLLYLVLDGRARVLRPPQKAGLYPVLLGIYQVDEFFGEAALLGTDSWTGETAEALETCQVMAWSAEEIERLMAERPKLAAGLGRIWLRRLREYSLRIESMAVDSMQTRISRCLVTLADKFGQPAADPMWTEMQAITHEMIAQWVGSSRELITLKMNEMRRQGWLQYSRRSIELYDLPRWKEWLAVGE